MNKQFFLLTLLFSFCLPVGMLANNPFAAHAPSPGEAMAGGMGQPPSFDGFDMLTSGVMPEDVIIQAYEVRRGLMCQKELNFDRIKLVERMIRDVSHNHETSMLKSYSFNLRRLDKLARLSAQEPFDRNAFDLTAALIDKREEMVKTLLQHCFKLRVGQQLLSDLTDENAKPQLDEKTKAAYEKEYKDICDQELAAVKKIQKELEPLEKELLKDNRTWGEKYGLVAATGGILVGGFLVFGLLGNALEDKFNNKEKDPNAAGA